MKITKAVGLAIDELHFVVKAFGDSVIAGKAPHGDDFFRPSGQSLAELHQLPGVGPRFAAILSGTARFLYTDFLDRASDDAFRDARLQSERVAD